MGQTTDALENICCGAVNCRQREIVGRAGKRGQGPFMEMHLRLDGVTIAWAAFETYGCPTAMRCGDWVAKWAVGRKPEALVVLEWEDLISVLGGVPLGKEHCAQLAVDALRDGLAQLKAGGDAATSVSP